MDLSTNARKEVLSRNPREKGQHCIPKATTSTVEISPKFSTGAGNSGTSVVFARKMIASTGFYWCCAPTRQHQ